MGCSDAYGHLGCSARVRDFRRSACATAYDGWRARGPGRNVPCPPRPRILAASQHGRDPWGTMRSPLTGIVFALELTHDFNALLPLPVANVIAYAVSVLVLKRS